MILIALTVGLVNGHQRGFWLSVVQFAALLLGVLLGAAIAPVLVSAFLSDARFGPDAKPLAAILILVVTSSVVTSLVHWLAEPVKRWATQPLGRPHWRSELDRAAGAAFSGLAVLLIVWFLGLTFANIPNPAVSQLVKGSAIESRLAGIAPQPPGFLNNLKEILSNSFPCRSAASCDILQPSMPSPLPIEGSQEDSPGVRAAAAETVMVRGHGCGGTVSGSGFPVLQPGLILTNAHVVAGTADTRVLTAAGQQMPASTILVDTNRDIAILQVPGLRLQPLPTATGQRGTQGVIIGYPQGGPRRITSAVIDGILVAQGRDIYNQGLVSREIFIVEGMVQPGNSGGPLVDSNGNLLGVVFAASTTRPNQAYALTDNEVAADLDKVNPGSGQIDTSALPCAI